MQYYQEFIESGEVKYNSHNIENYTYKSMAKKYSEILNEVVIE